MSSTGVEGLYELAPLCRSDEVTIGLTGVSATRCICPSTKQKSWLFRPDFRWDLTLVRSIVRPGSSTSYQVLSGYVVSAITVLLCAQGSLGLIIRGSEVFQEFGRNV